MKLCFISDTHGLHAKVKTPDCDVLIHSGDCTNDAGQASLRDFLCWLDDQPAKYKILIAGNHDWAFQKWPLLARELVKIQTASVTYLEDSGCEIDGIKFWGSPYQPEFFDWAFNLPRGKALKAHWDLIPPGTEVLVTHCPPANILDVSGIDNENCGCEDLRDAVCEIEPKIHAFGHIHHSYGQVKVGNTHFINASCFNERYLPINPPIVFDL